MESFLRALPVVAEHPLALVGYLAVVVAWLVVVLHSGKAKRLFNAIQHLPEAQRLEAIKLEYRTVPRAGLSADQWLRSRRMTFLFSALGMTLLTVIVLAAFAFVASLRFGTSRNSGQPIAFVVGSVYINYSGAPPPQQANPLPDGRAVFLKTEDARFFVEAGSKGLEFRFTIFNNGARKAKIYDFHTIEYRRDDYVSHMMGPRIPLEITPDRPFIAQDRTFEIEPADNISFRLRYVMRAEGDTSEVILGVVAYYHTSSGESGKAKSDKLYLVNDECRAVVAFDAATAASIGDIRSTSSANLCGDYLRLANLRAALKLHKAL